MSYSFKSEIFYIKINILLLNMNNVIKLINIINNYFSTFFNKQKKIKYIEDFDLINKTIISLSFNESPNFILYLKDDNNKYYQYTSNITKYPNYLYKNNEKISKNLFKKIKIQYISYYQVSEHNYYTIQDYDNNTYTLYSDKFRNLLNY
tara:strand:- start:13 stop:459 length:447 start_codon:yes stop_codon:yes gene_type:complete